MKTLNAKTITKNLSLLTLSLMAAMVMTACGSKSNNNNNNGIYNNGYGTICNSGCVNGGNLNVSAIGRNEASGIHLSIQFIGAQPTTTSTGPSDSYYGAVQAQGTITVQSTMYASCGLPPGQYGISTAQPGQWQGTSIFSNLVLTAASGVQIMMSGNVNTSATTGGYYQMNAYLYPGGSRQCEIDLY